MSSSLKSLPDFSMQLRPRGTGSADVRRLWVACGHKHHSGTKRGNLLWKCADCAKGKA